MMFLLFWLLGMNVDISWGNLFLLLFVAYVCYSMRGPYKFWRMGVPQRTSWPIVGSLIESRRKGFREFTRDALNYPPVHGDNLMFPNLVIRDLDILKDILIKDFPNFTNRLALGEIKEFPFDAVLTVLKDGDWKRVRNHLTPTFTANKMKLMTKQINEIADQLAKNMAEVCDKNEYFNVKKACGAFTMDVIARTTYGLQLDTQKDPENEFLKQGDAILTGIFKRPAFWILMLLPSLSKYFKYVGLRLFDAESLKFFVDVTRQTIAKRKETSATERDFLQLMIDAHKDEEREHMKDEQGNKGLSEHEVLAQGLIFFLAGYDTTSNTLLFIFYCLAANPEAQEKCYEEICEVVGDKKELTYDMMNELTYLDWCMQETMRLYPAAPRVNRVAHESRTYKGVYIPAGMGVTIPIYALHMDPEAWPQPEEFRPERFSPEEKEKRSPYQWAPFGHGPRNCVGMRLALLEMKMAMVSVLRQFRLVTGPETEIPPKVEKFRMTADIKLKLERREATM